MNESMIATSGKFDIIHADHINLFCQMSKLKPIVLVFLCSDYCIEQNTGSSPLNNQQHRYEVLKAIKWIETVVIYNQMHPHDFIRKFKPAIWAKGGDYDIEKMQSTSIVRAYGGEVITIPHKYGIHSSDIIKKAIKNRPIDCSDLWIYYVCEINDATVIRVVDAFTNEQSAINLVKRNKKEFPYSEWSYGEMEVTE